MLTRDEIIARTEKIEKRLRTMLEPFGVRIAYRYESEAVTGHIIIAIFDFTLVYGASDSRRSLGVSRAIDTREMEYVNYDIAAFWAGDVTRKMLELLAAENPNQP